MTPSDSPELWNQVKDILTVAIIPFCGYVVRQLNLIGQVARDTQVTLVGVDGKNGLRSRFGRLERRVESLVIAFAAKTGANIPHPEGEDEDE